MKEKKTPFFVKVKRAIFNFDEYKEFVEEKTSESLKYFFKLLLLFVLILTIAFTWNIVNEANRIFSDLKNECPEFKFNDDYVLEIKDSKRIVKGDNDGYFGIVIDSQKNELSQIEESSNYEIVIGVLKDKLEFKMPDSSKREMTYKELSEKYDINSVNKNSIIETMTRK